MDRPLEGFLPPAPGRGRSARATSSRGTARAVRQSPTPSGGYSPGGIVQGHLGSCWFVSAGPGLPLPALVEQPPDEFPSPRVERPAVVRLRAAVPGRPAEGPNPAVPFVAGPGLQCGAGGGGGEAVAHATALASPCPAAVRTGVASPQAVPHALDHRWAALWV